MQNSTQEHITHLECVHHSVKELNDKERRHLCLNDSYKEYLVPEHIDEVVVRGRDDRWDILRLSCTFLGLEEVIAHGTAHNTLPVLLQEDVPRGVHQE